jgi:hypothetical protein
MAISTRSVFFIAALTPLLAFADAPPGSGTPGASGSKWLYAGEIRGIEFQLRITGACKDGSKVAVRLKAASDEDLVVSFRLNDADWRKTFTHELKAGGKPVTLTFVPEDSQVCHPYVDQVEVSAAPLVDGPYRETGSAADASGADSP